MTIELGHCFEVWGWCQLPSVLVLLVLIQSEHSCLMLIAVLPTWLQDLTGNPAAFAFCETVIKIVRML